MSKRKIRRDFKFAKIIAFLLVFILSCFGIRYFLHTEDFVGEDTTVTYANYKSDFNCNYTVNTKENEFVNYNENKNYSAYVTNLIKNIDFTYNYKFEDTNKKKSTIKYKYSIDGKLLGFYSKDGEEQKVIEKDYVILPKTDRTVNDSEFIVNEKFNVDLEPFNKLIADFKASQDMQLNSRYDITMNIEITGLTNETLKYSPKISIELGNKTTKVTVDKKNANSSSANSKEVKVSKNSGLYAAILVIVAIYAGFRVIYLLFFTEEVLVIKNQYKGQVNDILRSYQDRIVLIKDMPQLTNKAIINLDNIDEIAKLSEELYKPILCYENDQETQTQFIIMSEDTAYVYKIKENKNKVNKGVKK